MKKKHLDDQDLQRKIGEKIRELRKAQRMSQLDLAVMIESHKTHIARIEKGEHNVGISTLQRLTIALEISLKEFFADL